MNNAENIFSNFNSDGISDNEFIAEVLNVYLSDIPIMSEQLEIAFSKKDLSSLKFYLHKLAGSLLNLGCEELVNLCRKLENSMKETNSYEDISNQISEIREKITKLVADLYKLKEKYSDSGKNPK